MEDQEAFSSAPGYVTCPWCCDHNMITFHEVPASVRQHVVDGVETEEFFGPTRDYRCGNCDQEWSMMPSDE